MSEQDLDRAIDTAAERMIAREPSRALSYNVMARVEGATEPSTHTLAWVAAAASIFLCVAIATAVMYRIPQTVAPVPSSRPLVVAQPATIPGAPIIASTDIRPPVRATSASVARRAAPRMAQLPTPLPAIEPLQPEPITVAAIDVPRLEPESTSIEVLMIEPLTIEPLAASND